MPNSLILSKEIFITRAGGSPVALIKTYDYLCRNPHLTPKQAVRALRIYRRLSNPKEFYRILACLLTYSPLNLIKELFYCNGNLSKLQPADYPQSSNQERLIFSQRVLAQNPDYFIPHRPFYFKYLRGEEFSDAQLKNRNSMMKISNLHLARAFLDIQLNFANPYLKLAIFCDDGLTQMCFQDLADEEPYLEAIRKAESEMDHSSYHSNESLENEPLKNESFDNAPLKNESFENKNVFFNKRIVTEEGQVEIQEEGEEKVQEQLNAQLSCVQSSECNSEYDAEYTPIYDSKYSSENFSELNSELNSAQTSEQVNETARLSLIVKQAAGNLLSFVEDLNREIEKVYFRSPYSASAYGENRLRILEYQVREYLSNKLNKKEQFNLINKILQCLNPEEQNLKEITDLFQISSRTFYNWSKFGVPTYKETEKILILKSCILELYQENPKYGSRKATEALNKLLKERNYPWSVSRPTYLKLKKDLESENALINPEEKNNKKSKKASASRG
ncbi:hypothetical protein CKF54_07285 [Psittacicella hinzii]|uniref:Uncharacterized protein n=1 Tax=Psittacicella hinzii TaxID=2028575 RepID=A0A3A1Y578_9GAMM|nr:hypothetical protein [Psittacicella hinzii]RIY31184.1 hypothetical protein CKF54_07285 [Psittacicella hinzii]